MDLVLPKKFETILKRENKYYGEIVTLLDKFSTLTKDNKLEFFPDYTDHGISHIQSVINTSEEIITDASFNILTPEDIYVLISAILLHDCAMHLDKYGLWELISNDIFNGSVRGKTTHKKWSDKWNDFQKIVNKFEEKDWQKFFGEYKNVELPEIRETNLSDNQKIIIGDFIRQHHADIAQVIASFGIPIKDGAYQIFNNFYTSLNELAGFIAKSHNYNLREMVDNIGGDSYARDYLNSHPAFIMGVLRISDYLQFKQDRTPKILFKIRGKGMCSPISLQEWKKHLSILHAHQNDHDSEVLFVETQPNDAQTLEGIKRLFSGFQNELDSFWAVNGEIYSRYPKLSPLGLNIRRIKSNIDNANEYIIQNQKNFYPEILTIQSDNQKIFPLLVSPLYGDYPQIGMRELIQNSLDACNERYSIETHKNVTKEAIPYQIDININLDNNTFIIEDNGIGMDIDVVKNYFLKIGASYRYSEVWKATHSDNQNVYVPRTGKFGIGMLAGFLIGEEIEVISKKEGTPNNEAIRFSYNINKQDIQVDFLNSQTTGTKIVIQSNEKNLQKILISLDVEDINYRNEDVMDAFWYYLDTPIIDINVTQDKQVKKFSNQKIMKKNDIFIKWNSVEDTDLQGFYWKMGNTQSRSYFYHNFLYCNGIVIKNARIPTISIDTSILDIDIPIGAIHIFDNLGQFPLNLTRNNLTTHDFFEIEKLSRSIKSDFFSKLKAIIQKQTWEGYFIWTQYSILDITNYYFSRLSSSFSLPFIYFEDCILPLGNKKLKDKYIFLDPILEGPRRGLIFHENALTLIKGMGYCCMIDSRKEARTTIKMISRYILKMNSKHHYSFNNQDATQINLDFDGWVFIKDEDLNKLDERDKSSLTAKDIVITPLNKTWSVVSTKANASCIPERGKIIVDDKNLNLFIFVIYRFNEVVSTEFSELWDKYIID